MPDTEQLVPAEAPKTPDFDSGWESHTEKFADEAAAMGVATEAQQEPTGVSEAGERDETGKFKAKSEKARHNPYTRVQEATASAAESKRLYKEAQDRIKALEDENTSLKRPRVEPAKVETKPEPTREVKPDPSGDFTRAKPTINDFLHLEAEGKDVIEAYNEALWDWKDEQKAAQTERKAKQEQWSAKMKTAADRMDEARANQPDFRALEQAADAIVAQAGFHVPDGKGGHVPALPPALLTALAESEHIVSLTRHFGSHPEVLRQWIRDTATLPASAATVVQRGLESLVSVGSAGARPDSAIPTRVASKAKPPVDRVGGSASATPVDPDELSFEEFVKKK